MAGKSCIIYQSGDPGSVELRKRFELARVPYVVRDIRHRDARGLKGALAELQQWGLRTVPQVFAPDGALVGGFEAAVAWLEAARRKVTMHAA